MSVVHRGPDSWMPYVKNTEPVLLPPRTALFLDIILAADLGGYRPKEELFADLSEQLPWIHAPAPGELERFWRQTFSFCGWASNNYGSLRSLTRTLRYVGYFALLAKYPKAAQWLSLGDKVDLMLDGELVQIR